MTGATPARVGTSLARACHRAATRRRSTASQPGAQDRKSRTLACKARSVEPPQKARLECLPCQVGHLHPCGRNPTRMMPARHVHAKHPMPLPPAHHRSCVYNAISTPARPPLILSSRVTSVGRTELCFSPRFSCFRPTVVTVHRSGDCCDVGKERMGKSWALLTHLHSVAGYASNLPADHAWLMVSWRCPTLVCMWESRVMSV